MCIMPAKLVLNLFVEQNYTLFQILTSTSISTFTGITIFFEGVLIFSS